MKKFTSKRKKKTFYHIDQNKKKDPLTEEFSSIWRGRTYYCHKISVGKVEIPRKTLHSNYFDSACIVVVGLTINKFRGVHLDFVVVQDSLTRKNSSSCKSHEVFLYKSLWYTISHELMFSERSNRVI